MKPVNKTKTVPDFIAKLKHNRAEIKQKLRRICVVVAAVLVFFSATAPGRSVWKYLSEISGFSVKRTAALSIHVLDVGKADAILIECDGHSALLDAGTVLNGDTAVDYITRCGIENLDYAIVSHPDKDHIGGMAQVLTEVPVENFVRSHYFTASYSGIEDIIKEKSITERTVNAGDKIMLGGAEITVLGPLQVYDDTNNCSLVLLLKYRGFSALFCGDIEEEAETDLLQCYDDLTVDLLKVAHHGSKTSSSKDFLSAVMPKYAVISVGRDNNKLPTEKVLKRLDNVCLDVYRTDTDGNIIFEYDGNEINVVTENKVE